jgi:predicted small metal-binding protein
MARKMADCRRFPSESNCSLTIIGEEEEVVRTAAEHAVSVHGHEDSDQLRDDVRGMLEDEDQYQPGSRPQEAMPG